MMEFLDTVRNHKDDPERELRPRAAGALHARRQRLAPATPNYTQDDIVQIARAFTGWRYDDEAARVPATTTQHDFDGATIPSAAQGDLPDAPAASAPAGATSTRRAARAPPRSTPSIDIIFEHTRHRQGKNTVARRTARRLLEFFAHARPVARASSTQVVDRRRASTRPGTSRALLRAIFVHDAFYETAAAPFGAGDEEVGQVAGRLRRRARCACSA